MAATPFPNDPFSDLLGYQLRRLSQLAMADLSAAVEPLGLKPTEMSVMFVIAENPGVTQSDVGRMLGIKRANMAPMIAALEARGAVSRAPMDGRSQALRLTAEGAQLAADARAATLQHERRCFGMLSDADRRALIARVRALWLALDEGAGDADAPASR